MHNIPLNLIIMFFLVLTLPFISPAAQKARSDAAGGATTFSTIISRANDVDMNIFAVHQTSDGGYISTTSGGDGAIITKTNSGGKKSWERVFGFISTGENIHPFGVSDIQQTSDGGYLFTGSDKYRLWLGRLKADGTTVWEKQLDGDVRSNSMVQNGDGTFLIAFGIWNKGNLFLAKYDANGNTIWKRQLFDNAGTIVSRGHQTIDKLGSTLRMVRYDGGLLIAYNTMDIRTSDHSGFRIVKLDGQGNTLWSKDVGDQIEKGIMPMLHSLTVTSDGGFVLYGNIYSRFLNPKAFVSKYERDGRHQWDSTIIGPIYDGGIVERTAGGFAVCGTYDVSSDSSYIMFNTMDKDGKIVATHLFGITDTTQHGCRSFEATRDGGFIIGGKYGGNTIGRVGGWLLKVDAEGNNPSEPRRDGKKLAGTVNRFDGTTANSILGQRYLATCDKKGAFRGTSNGGSFADFNIDSFEAKRHYRLTKVMGNALWEPGETAIPYQIDRIVAATFSKITDKNIILKGTLKRGPCLADKPLICKGSDENQNIIIKPGKYLVTFPERRCDGKTGNIYQREIFIIGLPVEEGK